MDEKNVGLYVKKFMIDVAVLITNDSGTIKLVKSWELSGLARAIRFLDHYLGGSGEDVAVDIGKLVSEDPSVARLLKREITSAISNGNPFGVVKVEQADFSNRDWQYSVGTIHVRWSVVSGPMRKSDGADFLYYELSLFFKDRYRWYPHDDRVSKSVHKVMERQKEKGVAKEFWIVGKGDLEIEIPASEIKYFFPNHGDINRLLALGEGVDIPRSAKKSRQIV